jgi:pilus assembly protein FimV
MVAKSVKWALASLVIFPPAAFALGLGDVRLLSALNAPLDAEIEILGATPEEMVTLKAQIASTELFQRYGLERPPVLNAVTMTATKNAAGKEVIRLRTTEAITEPFLTMLVEVNSARNHLVREYDLLLDPPVYTPGPQVADAPVAAPSTSDSARSGQIARAPATPPPARAQEPASSSSSSPSESSSAPPPSSASAGTTRTVQRGETLSGIASEVSGSAPTQSRAWMLAIYQNNPAAFDGNMNVMRSGSVLRIPDNATAAAISPAEASAEIRRQWSAWRGSASGPATASTGASSSDRGQLRLVTPAEPGASTGPADPALKAENSRLQGRVSELQAQLDESRRLLELKNSEVANLQARLSQQQSSSTAPTQTPPPAEKPAASAQPTPPAETPPAETPPAQASTEQPPAAAAEPAPEAQPAPEPVRKPVAAAAPASEKSGSIFDTLTEYWWVGAALLVAALAFFGLRAFRSRQRNEFDDSLSRLAASSAGAAALDRGDFGSSDTQPLRAGGGAQREAAFVVEESGTHERPRFGGEVASAPRNVNVPADDTISSETAINLDQGDPLAEADFHMAYGLYDQAADLVRIAISREPGRRDLKLKLLEVFFVWGNKEQFLQTARELAETRERAQSGEWEKIVIMGKQLAPEDPLFAGSGASSSAGFGGVDLDLEGGQSRVDFDLLGDPVAANGGGDIDLDIGSALGESGDGQTVTDANLALHEEEAFAAAGTGTQTTRQMTQKIRQEEPTVATYGGDFEAPTVEQPQLYGNGANQTVRQKVETAMRQGSAAEQTAELAIDDLGLDLSALDTMDQPGIASTQEAPTLVAGLDERSRRIMDEAERRGMRGNDPDATAISSTGSWNLAGGEDLEQTMPPQQVGRYQNGAGDDDEIDLSETSRLKVASGKDLDFNFNDVDDDAPSIRVTNGSGAGIDLDVGTATVPDTAFTSTQKLNSEDLALPDMEPVTMSEVGTKLDLARAYMDMGDPEGARNILEEVMQEGSVAQKQEAQRLIESLPG